MLAVRIVAVDAHKGGVTIHLEAENEQENYEYQVISFFGPGLGNVCEVVVRCQVKRLG